VGHFVTASFPFRHTYTNLSKQNESVSTDLLLTSCFIEASFTCRLYIRRNSP